MSSLQEISHYVSMIPFLDDWQAFGGKVEVWCTCQQLLDLSAGDWEEHATILCNFFAFVDERDGGSHESFIVIGNGAPEGNTVYVMRRKKGVAQVGEKKGTPDAITLWNASMGTKYAASDSSCPLRAVHVVADRNNVWGNRQAEEQPHRISWNLEDAKCWTLFFPRKDRACRQCSRTASSTQNRAHHSPPCWSEKS